SFPLPIPPLFPLNTTSYQANPTDSPSELTFFPLNPTGAGLQSLPAAGLRERGSFWFYLVLNWIDLLIYPVDMWIS
ncbi:hypothetical protein, partial [Citrobacter freundii]|uniref:hypothetical protein n=1 Tax=Citrobacter freundii TaxID=546 RepID=UPI0019D23DF6